MTMIEEDEVKMVEEGAIKLKVSQFHSKTKTKGFLNPVMRLNRDISLCTLTWLIESKDCNHKLKCLDAFASTGILGMRWASEINEKERIEITVNDLEPKCIELIQENLVLNGLEGQMILQNQDASVLLHQQSFDYIHLDPFGSCVPFLDSTFSSTTHQSVITFTSTDTATLYCHYPNIARRHYGVFHLERTEYFRELGVRMVISSIAQSAARRDRGIQVLCAISVEHFVCVIVQILRGAKQADLSTEKVGYISHCKKCQERSTQKHVSCECAEQEVVDIGPIWLGPLFDSSFIRQISKQSESSSSIQKGKKFSKLMPCLVEESYLSEFEQEPVGYYNYHNYCKNGKDLPKLEKVIQKLKEMGFVASKSHFEKMAIRTNASTKELKSAIHLVSVIEKNT